jgi:hypothetical protein
MSKAGEMFDEVGKSYFDQDSKPVTRVYVDLEYMQDLRFGALLYDLHVEAEMKYIHSCLKRYNARYDFATAEYFPALNKTDEELDKLLHTNVVKDRICFIAPFTSVYYNLLEALDMFKSHNKRMLETETPMTLFINCADIDYPIELQRRLQSVLSHQLDIKVEFQQIGRYESDVKDYLNYDLLFLYEYGKFVNTFPTRFVGEGDFINTKIVAKPYIEKQLGYKPDRYDEVIASTERGMDIYCDFNFLKSEITLNSKEE